MSVNVNATIKCDICRVLEGSLTNHVSNHAVYALSFAGSNSAANIVFVCRHDVVGQLDQMLRLGLSSIKVEAIISGDKIKRAVQSMGHAGDE